jgi:threonine synthase
MTVSTYRGLECLRCGARGDEDAAAPLGCPSCAADGFAVSFATVYDVDAAAEAFAPERLAAQPPGLWRYRELLPPVEAPVTLGEGATALVPAERLAERVGLAALWIKDESRNPTWSFKDRAAAVGAAVARERGGAGLVVSSTGNAAAATSAYARRAGLPAVALVTRTIDPTMAGFLAAYGASMLATETKAERWTHMRRCVEEWGLFPNSNFADPPVGNSPWAVDGYKTIAFELWEALGRRAPDWVHLPVAYGDGLWGICKGFRELEALGLATVPRFGCGEIYGSLARAVAQGDEQVGVAAVDRDTVAFSIATAQSTYQALTAVRSSAGAVDQVSEDEVLDAHRLLVETEGLFVETAAAAGLAALLRQRRRGVVAADAECVLVSTSGGLKSLAAAPQAAAPILVDSAATLDRELERLVGANLVLGRREAE